MLRLLRKIYATSLFYSVANGIEALTPFFIAIILTRLITPHEYGVWVLFVSLVTFLRPFVNLNVQDSLKMNYYEMDQSMKGEFVVSAFQLSTIMAVFLTLISILFNDIISELILFPREWISSIVLSSYIYGIFYFLLAYKQFSFKKMRFVSLQALQACLSIGMITILVLGGFGWEGAVAGKIAGLLLACLFGIYWLTRDLEIPWSHRSAAQLKAFMRFGIVYLPTGVGLAAVPLTDRLIISHMLGLDENGLYGVAALFGSAFFIAINGFLHAWMPWLFQRLGRAEIGADVKLVSLTYVLVLPVAAILFYFVVIVIAPYLIGASFSEAFDLIPWAIAGTVTMGYFYHFQAFLLFKKSILAMSISSFSSIVLNIVLSYVGAIHYGMIGILLATVAAFLVSTIITCAFILRKYGAFHQIRPI